jgi:hypothetical protein
VFHWLKSARPVAVSLERPTMALDSVPRTQYAALGTPVSSIQQRHLVRWTAVSPRKKKTISTYDVMTRSFSLSLKPRDSLAKPRCCQSSPFVVDHRHVKSCALPENHDKTRESDDEDHDHHHHRSIVMARLERDACLRELEPLMALEADCRAQLDACATYRENHKARHEMILSRIAYFRDMIEDEYMITKHLQRRRQKNEQQRMDSHAPTQHPSPPHHHPHHSQTEWDVLHDMVHRQLPRMLLHVQRHLEITETKFLSVQAQFQRVRLKRLVLQERVIENEDRIEMHKRRLLDQNRMSCDDSKIHIALTA